MTLEIWSLSSKAIQSSLSAVEIDAGVTYLENEPLTQVRRLPLYVERYLLATVAGSALAMRSQIGWREASAQRLCLLSEDMQNRRILNALFDQQNLEIRRLSLPFSPRTSAEAQPRTAGRQALLRRTR